jgi:hypothetical protein
MAVVIPDSIERAIYIVVKPSGSLLRLEPSNATSISAFWKARLLLEILIDVYKLWQHIL